jgi:hypothetical protein
MAGTHGSRRHSPRHRHRAKRTSLQHNGRKLGEAQNEEGDKMSQGHKPNIARDGSPKKKLHPVEVAFRQRTRSSTTDILRGSAKRTAVAPVTPGMRSRIAPHNVELGDLGAAIFQQAARKC